MSLDYFNNYKFKFFDEIFFLENLEINLRKKLFIFESSPLKTKKRIENFHSNVISNHEIKLKEYEDNIKGFNLEIFFFGITLYHTSYIFLQKKLLNEMGKYTFLHLSSAVLFGALIGYSFGFYFAKSYAHYKTYNKTLNNIKRINSDFQKYYVANHEEVFDE